jgi:hypothetical protein
LFLEPRPPVFEELTRAFHSTIIVADNLEICQDPLFEGSKAYLLHSYIQLQAGWLIYTESLEVNHGNVIPTEKPPIIVLNEIPLTVSKDDEFVGVRP